MISPWWAIITQKRKIRRSLELRVCKRSEREYYILHHIIYYIGKAKVKKLGSMKPSQFRVIFKHNSGYHNILSVYLRYNTLAFVKPWTYSKSFNKKYFKNSSYLASIRYSINSMFRSLRTSATPVTMELF